MKADIDFCRSGSIASIERRPWHVGFTPDSGRIVAAQRTDVMGHEQTSAERAILIDSLLQEFFDLRDKSVPARVLFFGQGSRRG